MEHTALVILNPVAGTSDGRSLRQTVEDSLREAGWDFQILETEEDTDITAMTRDALSEDYDMVMAVGGDGTVSGVAGGLLNTDMPLGVVPAGTGNALARSLGIPQDPAEAIRAITGDHTVKPIHALRVGDRVFILNVSAGISAATMKGAEREDKQKLGMLAYIRDAVKQLAGAQPAYFEVMVDDQYHNGYAAEVAVISTGFLATELVSRVPYIDLKEDEVAVFIIRVRSMADYLIILWNLLLGRERQDRRVRAYHAHQTVSIKLDRDLPIQADGEPLNLKEVSIEIVPHAVRVIKPA